MKKLISMALTVMIILSGCTKEEMTENNPEINSNTLATAAASSADGSVGDANIRYFGRWDFTATNQYISYWGGAYIKVNFTGTSVKIKVGNTSNFYAKIDNGLWVSYKNVGGTIDLTPSALAKGTHSLSVAQGRDYDYIFNFRGLVLDAGASTSAPTVGTDIIEYIGDSITAGYTDDQANVSDYAWVCAEALGAEHTQIAYPGITLVNGFGINDTKIGMEVQYFKTQSLAFPSSPNWNFAAYTPKIVVINLGQNDEGTGVSNTDFQNSYISFLTNIRARFANAEIFVMRTFMDVKSAPARAAVSARIAAGDSKVHFIDTKGWLTYPSSDYNSGGTDIHPSVSGHIKAANLLKTYLAPYLTSSSSASLDQCDDIAGWASGNTLTVNTTDIKEGTGALQSQGSSILEFQKHLSTPVNTGATKANGSIDFWYYVSDVTKLGTDNQIEIGSAGTNDVNEYNWDMGTLVNGWNHITKTFATAGNTGGTPNLSAINWFRIYHTKTGNVTTRIDAVKIIH